MTNGIATGKDIYLKGILITMDTINIISDYVLMLGVAMMIYHIWAQQEVHTGTTLP
jgi:hypothetical protein